MNTALVLRKWAEAESTVEIADRTGIQRPTVSRHMNGKAPVLPQHIAAYLEHAPADIRAELLGAWLRDTVPPDLHAELLGDGGLPLSHVGEWSASPDGDLLDRMTFLLAEAMRDPELRRLLLQFCDWMGYDSPVGQTGDAPDFGDVDPRDEHKTSTACAAGDVLSS